MNRLDDISEELNEILPDSESVADSTADLEQKILFAISHLRQTAEQEYFYEGTKQEETVWLHSSSMISTTELVPHLISRGLV